jgi:lipoprotein-anchoring transpeptidase ErfK/SrfK
MTKGGRGRCVGAFAIGVAAALAIAAEAQAAPKVTVYMTQGSALVPVQRTIPPRRGPVDVAFKALVKGPTRAERASGIGTAIPRAVRAYSVKVIDGVAYVRASRQFSIQGTRAARRMRLAQLAQTLLQFPKVHAVRLLGRDDPLPPSTAANPPGSLVTPATAPRRQVLVPLPLSVADVQRRLAELRYLPSSGAITGALDYRTSQALTAFQAWEGLSRSGLADATTRRRMQRAAIPKAGELTAGRRVEIYRAQGVVLLIQNLQVQRVVHASTGAGGRTPSGTFHVFRKERLSYSVPFHVYMPYASYFFSGDAMHAYPSVPAYPASHGCVRLSAPEAPIVYDFAVSGTPVRIF